LDRDNSYDLTDLHPNRKFTVNYLDDDGDLDWISISNTYVDDKMVALMKYRTTSIKGAIDMKSLRDIRIL
jgi:hypothetical protein